MPRAAPLTLRRTLTLFALLASAGCSSSAAVRTDGQPNDAGAEPEPDSGSAPVNDDASSSAFDAGVVPPLARNSSFFPVTATGADGGAADLYWRYRINHGQPNMQASAPGLTFTFDDSITGIHGSRLVQTVTDTFTSSSGDGATTSTRTQNLSGPMGATTEIDVDTSTDLAGSTAGLRLSEIFGAMPIPTVLDRTDLDMLAVGYGESVPPISGMVNATSTSSSNGTTRLTGTVSTQSSWMVLEHLATFTVLGVAYPNVVKVQIVTSADVSLTDSVGTMSSSTTNTTSTSWLAKGIGTIRAELATQQSSGTTNELDELVTTNLAQ